VTLEPDHAEADEATAPVTAATAGQSAIADVSYRNYDGEMPLRPLLARAWTIAAATVRANVNRRKFGYWIPAALILVINFFLGIIHYVTQNVRDQMAAQAAMTGGLIGGLPEGPANPYALTLYQGVTWSLFLVFIAALTVGSSTIAADNRANALLVYFARPITRLDYLVGKWVGLFLLLAPLTLVPSLLLYLFFVATYNDVGFLKENPTLIFRLLGATLFPAALHASLMLGFSAWSKTPRMAGAVYAGFYFVVSVLSGVAGNILLERDQEQKQAKTTAIVSNLSVSGVASGVAMNLYDVTPRQVVARFQSGGRRRRRPTPSPSPTPPAVAATPAPSGASPAPAAGAPDGAREPRRPRRRGPVVLPERPGMPAMLFVGGLMIVLPLAAAHAKVRAVEVVRG